MMDEIEGLLSRWFDAEYAARTSNFGEGRNLEEQREEARQARSELAFRLATLHEPTS